MPALEDGGARIRVPIGEAALAAWQAVFTRLGLVLELGWLPLLLLLAAALLPGLVTDYLWPALNHGAAAALDVGDIAEAVMAPLCLGAFAVRWHQAMLLPEKRAATRRAFLIAWGRFMLYTVVFSLPMIALFAALALAPVDDEMMAMVSSAAAAVIVVATSLAIPRLALLLPAAACGQKLGIKAAWRQMRGNGWRLGVVTLIVCLPVIFVFGIVLDGILIAARLDPAEALASAPSLGLFLLEGTLEVLIDFLLVALGAAILAEFYRRIVLRVPRPRGPPG